MTTTHITKDNIMVTEQIRAADTDVHRADASAQTLVAAATAIGPLIRESIDVGERDRRLPATTMRALTEAGFFRLCRPHHLGGLEADPITVAEVVEELARHDGSAAWCAVNCGVAGVLQSFTDPAGVSEIGTAPEVIVNGVINPTGRAVEVDGGYRVSGRWAFVSNCHHCTWLAPSSIVFKGDTMSSGPTGPAIVVTWIPASDWQIIDTWDTAGLRATGSHDIEVSDVFVPAHRTFPLPFPDPVPSGALFRFPVVALWSVGLAAVALGIAQAAIDETIRLAGAKTPFGMTSTLATRATAQIAVCDAIATVGSARALLVEETSRMWRLVQAGTSVTPEQVAALRIAATHATAATANAVDGMYTAAGGSAVFASNPLQRHLRDVHMITQHHFVAPPTYEMVGKIVLGVESDGFML
jgi:alkylation response protein AidB-like acyl-CoA dehydrogenase